MGAGGHRRAQHGEGLRNERFVNGVALGWMAAVMAAAAAVGMFATWAERRAGLRTTPRK